MTIAVAAASAEYLTAASEFATLRTTSSLSFWLSTTTAGTSVPWTAPAVTGREQGGGADDIFWGYLDNSPTDSQLQMQKGNGAFVQSGDINDGTMRHYVLTWNSATGAAEMFVNGVSVSSVTTETGDVTSARAFTTLFKRFDGANYMDGSLDDVRMYNRILSANEAATLYAQRGGDSIFNGLVHRYRMDEGAPTTTVTTTVDDVGGNTATATATPTYEESVVQARRAA